MKLVINKKAKFDYQINKTYTAGIVLEGREVKSLRLKHASLTGSFIKIINGEAFLLNAQINPYAFAPHDDYDPKRSRKLLLNKKELNDLYTATQNKGWVIIPLAIFLKGRNIKIDIGLGKGKKLHEKREVIKKRDLERESRRGEM